MDDELDLASLLCSRLCHDLVSPVGAISNGLELLSPSGPEDAEVRALLADSVRAAGAALGFFRVAFGAAGEATAAIPTQDLGAIAGAYYAAGRHRLDWPLQGDPLPRPLAKLMLLMLLTGATATPIGGALHVAAPRVDPLALRVTASGRRAGLSAESRSIIAGRPEHGPVAPRDAHLALLGRHAAAVGAVIAVSADGEEVTLTASAGDGRGL